MLAASLVEEGQHFLLSIGASVAGEGFGPEMLHELLGYYVDRLPVGTDIAMLIVDTGDVGILRVGLLKEGNEWED